MRVKNDSFFVLHHREKNRFQPCCDVSVYVCACLYVGLVCMYDSMFCVNVYAYMYVCMRARMSVSGLFAFTYINVYALNI